MARKIPAKSLTWSRSKPARADAWRECPYYSDRERAALAWTVAVTRVAGGHVPDAVHEQVRPFFSEKELADLTLAVAAINAWNRLGAALRFPPPIQKKVATAA